MSNEVIRFNCGCEFKKNEQGKIVVPIDTFWDDLNYNCSAAWDLINSGDVKCGFQIESSFGQQLVKRLKFKNIDDLAALLSISRPGCNDAKLDDGKSITEHYIDRVNGKEDAIPLNPALHNALKDTYFLPLFQEQIQQISKDIAGFNGSDADDLRKNIGKKDQKGLSIQKDKFINGCIQCNIVTEEEANTIWNWIAACGKYLFNRCVSPETVVETDKGQFKTLDEVQIGEYIQSPSGLTKVVNKYENGNKELYEITTESGKTITCTLEHKFLTENGEILPLFEIIDKNLKIICQQG